MEMIKDRPFLGHGFDSFKVKYLDYQATYFKDNSKDKRNIYLADNTRTAFNDYMLIIAEQGIFAGVLIFIAIFLLLKKNNASNVEFTSCLVVLLCASLFSYPLYMAPTGVNISIYVALIVNNSGGDFKNKSISLKYIYSILGMILLILSSCNSVLFYKWNRAYYGILRMEKLAFSRYYDILPYMARNGNFMYNLGSELIISGNNVAGIEILETSKKYFNDNLLYLTLGDAYSSIGEYQFAEEHYLHSIDLVPNRIVPRYKLLLLYEKVGNKEKCKDLAVSILNMDIKIPSKTVDRIRLKASDTIVD